MEISIDPIGTCLERISLPNAFYLVLLSAFESRERGMKPVEALQHIASDADIEHMETHFMRSLRAPASQAIETVATSAHPGSEAIDQFGQNGDEEALLQAMESHLASNTPNARLSRARYNVVSETTADESSDGDEGASENEASSAPES